MSKQKQFQDAVLHNNIEKAKRILKNKNFNPAYDNNFAIRSVSEDANVEFVEMLLEDQRVDPSDCNNHAIIHVAKIIYINILEQEDNIIDKYKHIFLLLWDHKNVKNTLKNNEPKLYEKLIKRELEKKLNLF